MSRRYITLFSASTVNKSMASNDQSPKARPSWGDVSASRKPGERPAKLPPRVQLEHAPEFYGKVTIKLKGKRALVRITAVAALYWQRKDIAIYQYGPHPPTRIPRESIVRMLCE